MEIKIKKIGWNVGTIGWLAAGLQDGSLALIEGNMKSNGHHGLWLEGGTDKVNILLAAYDRYDVGDRFPSASRYDPTSEPGDMDTRFTNATRQVLREIAQDWCDACNADREADQPTKMKITRVSAGVA